ncbi:hypothetical protein IFM58399_05954 [Aspergillus lentulus]|uniref:Uncharacterized protein n=1 Tax=Aspergillus lentulus TaxID=293939 RepID=A0AAN5YMY4_ASPLE|nr:uncharacterized protein IFM58399_05954 [Aspergillus lentulus]KAF4155809.1 hypothetical protein CNMCM6069_007570 [Aspergillus lentulus]KAF4166252.1 hypothetical protein CNMCM6936_006673 [Aspergillus lentulus]KAF4176818.1 hypothetical protein CNMCM8060_005922 [Aspergillus lentulus]KAF4188494.1 hypothetical protein CNMCM7927_001700 [Aspergillus lentulus]KAF4197174.1 hypothetical protein CNMCM8694_003662 [Aspergillus lentulus]
MADQRTTPQRRGSWTKVVIFVSLYVLLLESLIEWVLVIFLFVNRQVDSKMLPSLVLILIASLFTVPLVVLHSLLAWQYNRVQGFWRQKKFLHGVCTYLLRLTIIVWVAASVAGLVVISQQISCLPDSMNGGFWKTGVSCALHRAAVIISVLSFITVCLYFCSRELCRRPYDVSLLGVYSQRQPIRGDSVCSQTSFDRESCLSNDIYYLCRGPDVTFGTQGVYIPSGNDDLMEKSLLPTIQHPRPIRPKSQLRLDTDQACEAAEILSGTTLASTVSRTPTVATLKTASEASFQNPPCAELSGTSEVPPIPSSLGHLRQKSSISSLCRSLLKVLPISIPLSADPQIRALAEAEPRRGIEQQERSDDVTVKQEHTGQSPDSSPSQNPSPSSTPDRPSEMESSVAVAQLKGPSRPRSMTANSADAPEVVAPPATFHRSNPSNTLSAYQPQHPAYMLIPPNQIARRPMDRPPSRRVSLIEPNTVARRHTHRYGQRQRPSYQFDPNQIPRHTQSHHHRPHQQFEQYRTMGPAWRRNDVEIIYPSTRRPRSSTCGGLASLGHGPLDSIRETGSSVDEARAAVTLDDQGRRTILDGNTYRGANRTSMHRFS